MPTIGTQRKQHGPNGPENYISDNPSLILTRDVNNRISQIELLTVEGITLFKDITRAAGGFVSAVSRWYRI